MGNTVKIKTLPQEQQETIRRWKEELGADQAIIRPDALTGKLTVFLYRRLHRLAFHTL